MKNLRESYKFYKANAEQELVDIKTYLKVVHLFMKFIISEVLKGERINFPEKMGSLEVKGAKQKLWVDKDGKVRGLSPNWRKTKELWDSNEKAKQEKTLVYNTNEHSDGVRYRYSWRKRGHHFKNGALYSIRLTRANKRALYSAIKDGAEYISYE
jgi:hypothetical protein